MLSAAGNAVARRIAAAMDKKSGEVVSLDDTRLKVSRG
jgi:hypothetical protein